MAVDCCRRWTRRRTCPGQQDLATRNLLPGTHVLDSGYVDAELLVTAQTQHRIDVVGPTFGSYSGQRLAGQGYALDAFVIDWEAE
jgi:transposase